MNNEGDHFTHNDYCHFHMATIKELKPLLQWLQGYTICY